MGWLSALFTEASMNAKTVKYIPESEGPPLLSARQLSACTAKHVTQGRQKQAKTSTGLQAQQAQVLLVTGAICCTSTVDLLGFSLLLIKIFGLHSLVRAFLRSLSGLLRCGGLLLLH